ncbi:MAG: DUF6524 family protein [Steroidobacteraceae bacterium]
MGKFNLLGMAWRVAFSIALVYLTFNPSGTSYYHWLADGFPSITPAKAIAGLLLVGAWLFFVRSTFNALGALGVGLLVALFGCIVWWLVARGWLNLGDRAATAWVVLGMVGVVLGIGMSWSLFRQKVSGQASVDRVD